jgi:hypothetical protein
MAQLHSVERDPGSNDSNNTRNKDFWRNHLNIIRFDVHGNVVWKRDFAREQTDNVVQAPFDGWNYWSMGGKTLDVNAKHLLIGGTTIKTSNNSSNTDASAIGYIAQFDKDGREFNKNGWTFLAADTKIENVSMAIAPPADLAAYERSSRDLISTVASVSEYDWNDMTLVPELTYIVEPSDRSVTINNGDVIVGNNGSVNLSRKTVGQFVNVGAFNYSNDYAIQQNNQGDMWFNGVTRDADGNSYIAGAWYPTDNYWNDDTDYVYVPLLTKVNPAGELVYQVGTTLNEYATAYDVAVSPDGSSVSMVQFDGNEGNFFVVTHDAETGTLTGTKYIHEDTNSTSINSLAVQSDGTPVVVGYYTDGYDFYANVTQGNAGLTGSTVDGTLVLPMSVFQRTEGNVQYPDESGYT